MIRLHNRCLCIRHRAFLYTGAPKSTNSTLCTGGNEVPGLEGVFVTAGKDHVECLNSSFGSIEGYGEGGEDRGEARGEEVSLELQVTRLQHQVLKLLQ